jgi:hypothetical protein
VEEGTILGIKSKSIATFLVHLAESRDGEGLESQRALIGQRTYGQLGKGLHSSHEIPIKLERARPERVAVIAWHLCFQHVGI